MTRVIDRPVLVLNRHWQPVTFLTVGVVVTTVVREMGWVVHPVTYELLDFDAWCAKAPSGSAQIKTPSGGVPAPEIVVLKEYAGQPKRSVVFSRRSLYRRDEHACQYCGRQPGSDSLTIDHILPRSRGGPTSWENCVAACESCNHRKADRTPREAGMPLRTEPARPRWRPTLPVARAHFQRSWETFVNKGAAFQVELR